MSGWIAIHRKIKDHWLWPKSRPMTKLEAWLTILMEVNHRGEKISFGNDIYECQRGEKLYSLDTWGRIFGWDKSKVKRFFDCLKNDTMIEVKSERKTTRIKVCNYDIYQVERNTDETQVKREPKRERNQYNNDNNKQEDITTSSLNRNDISTTNLSLSANSANLTEHEQKNEEILTRKQRTLSGKRLKTFLIFWDKFNYKKGRAEAADSWIDIPVLTAKICEQIFRAAEIEAKRRPEIIKTGHTPKMAQGWLTARRWEDEFYKQDYEQSEKPKLPPVRGLAR